jgi:hypothetical protein
MKDLSEDIIEILQEYVFQDEQVSCTMKLNDLFQSEIKLLSGNKDAIIEKQREYNKYLLDVIDDNYILMKRSKYESELSALQSGAERGAPFDESLRDELINFCKEYKAYYHSIVNLSIAEKTDYEKFIDEYLKSRNSVTMHDLLNDDSAREERK